MNGEEAESGQEENLRVTPWRTWGPDVGCGTRTMKMLRSD